MSASDETPGDESHGTRQQPAAEAALAPPAQPGVVVEPGKGGLGIVVGVSTLDEVRKRLGEPSQQIPHGSYSVEWVYEALDVHVWHCHGDATQRLFGVAFGPSSNAETTEGLRVGSTTMQEAFEIYGPGEWGTTQDNEHWWVEFPGVRLSVLRDLSLPQFPLDETRHVQRAVVEIAVFDDSSCD